MALQQQISADKLANKVGKRMTVLVDEIDVDEGIAICRSYADAPEIDGHVYVDNLDAGVKAGQMLTVMIDEASEYDLFASYRLHKHYHVVGLARSIRYTSTLAC